MNDNFKYQLANASSDKLGRAHYVIDLKEERLISSSEAFLYLKDLRRVQGLRNIIRSDYQSAGIENGWEPKLAAIPHIENLALQLSHVLGVMAMNEHIPSPHHNLYQSSVVTKGRLVEISITVPKHEDISASGLIFDYSSQEIMSVRMFAPERTVPWKLTLTSSVPIEKVLSSCCRGVTRLRDLEQEDVRELAHNLRSLSEHDSRSDPINFCEEVLLLGMMSGLAEVGFEARVTIGEVVSAPFQLSRYSVLEDERLDIALRSAPSPLIHEIVKESRLATLKQAPGFSYPIAVPWRVVFERAQSAEHLDTRSDGEIRDERLQRAVGLAYIESLPLENLSDSSRVVTALTHIDAWLDANRNWPKDNPQVLRYNALKEIITKNRDLFESLIPPVQSSL